MFETLEFEMLTRLFLAAVLGGVVGIERAAATGRPACVHMFLSAQALP
jgi:uncharacterized membrane protein YhiD involved in acid resistance